MAKEQGAALEALLVDDRGITALSEGPKNSELKVHGTRCAHLPVCPARRRCRGGPDTAVFTNDKRGYDSAPVLVGSDAYASDTVSNGQMFHGWIADVAVYATQRTQAQIQAVMNDFSQCEVLESDRLPYDPATYLTGPNCYDGLLEQLSNEATLDQAGGADWVQYCTLEATWCQPECPLCAQRADGPPLCRLGQRQ